MVDDQKVRNQMVGSCGEIATHNLERRPIVMGILVKMLSDKAVMVRERVLEVITELGLHDIRNRFYFDFLDSQS